MDKYSENKKTINDEKSSTFEHFSDGFKLLISTIISVIVLLVSTRFSFSFFETCTTTMLSFLLTECIIHSFLEKSKYFKAKREYPLTDALNTWTKKLYDMNELCKLILERSLGQQDLFIITCKKSIDNLFAILNNAAQDKIEITSDFIVNSDVVFEALKVTEDKTVRLTFPIDKQSGILNIDEDKKFFETSYKKAQNNEAIFRELIILETESMIKNPQVIELFSFFKNENNFDGKYIYKKDFVKICTQNGLSSSQLDFGIYGPKMLFKLESYDPYKGIYTKSTAEVERYKQLFDHIWNFASVTHDLTTVAGVDSQDPLPFEQLLEDLSNAKI